MTLVSDHLRHWGRRLVAFCQENDEYRSIRVQKELDAALRENRSVKLNEPDVVHALALCHHQRDDISARYWLGKLLELPLSPKALAWPVDSLEHAPSALLEKYVAQENLTRNHLYALYHVRGDTMTALDPLRAALSERERSVMTRLRPQWHGSRELWAVCVQDLLPLDPAGEEIYHQLLGDAFAEGNVDTTWLEQMRTSLPMLQS